MLKLKLISLLIVFAILGGVWYYLTGNYSDGFRAGTLVKLSRKGYIFKTYEGQLNLGLIISQDQGTETSINNIWEFSVDKKDSALIDSLEDFMGQGRRVRLHYREKYRALPWKGDTRYFIYKVDSAPRL